LPTRACRLDSPPARTCARWEALATVFTPEQQRRCQRIQASSQSTCRISLRAAGKASLIGRATASSDTLSSLADFPISPVIRPTLLQRFRAGTSRASPIAQYVLVSVLSLTPRQGDQPHRSVFGLSY